MPTLGRMRSLSPRGDFAPGGNASGGASNDGGDANEEMDTNPSPDHRYREVSPGGAAAFVNADADEEVARRFQEQQDFDEARRLQDRENSSGLGLGDIHYHPEAQQQQQQPYDDEENERSDHDVVLSMYDGRYKEVIVNMSNELWGEQKSHGDNRVGPDLQNVATQIYDEWMGVMKTVGGTLLRASPGLRSVRKATKKDAIKKIKSDLQQEKRKLLSSGKRQGTPGNEDADHPAVAVDGPPRMLSSTRTSKGGCTEFSINSTRDYLAMHITKVLNSTRHPEWKVKRRCQTIGDDIWVAKKEGCDVELSGYSNIIDEAYRMGIYEEFFIGTEEGREYLDEAGILEDPHCIFSEEVKRERTRRKLNAGGEEEELESVAWKETPVQLPGIKSFNRASYDSDCVATAETIFACAGPHEPILRGTENPSLLIQEAETQSQTRAVYISERLPEECPEVNRTAEPVGKKIIINTGCTETRAEENTKSIHTTVAAGVPSDQSARKHMATVVTGPGEPVKVTTSPSDGVINENEEKHESETRSKNQGALAVSSGLPEEAPNIVAAVKSPSTDPIAHHHALHGEKVRELYNSIRTKLLSARKRKRDNSGGGGDVSTFHRINFYTHLKGWLAHKRKLIVDADLAEIRRSMDDFESVIAHLEDPENDDYDIEFYDGECKDEIKKIRVKFPRE